MTDRQTDPQTHRHTDARGKTICLPTLTGGRHNSYNLFFYRFVVIFNMKYHFFEDISQKSIIFDAIIGARMNIERGPGFYFIEDGYQDTDRCHVVIPRWPTLIDRTLFSASVNKNATLRYRKDFFHGEFKGSTF